MSNPWNDPQQYGGAIESVHEEDDGFEVTWDGLTCWVPGKDVTPKVGDRLTTWGPGIFRPFRGIAINDHVAWYRTEAEEAAKVQRDREEREQKQRAEYDAKRADHDERISKLPEPFRLRIQGFRDRNGDFGWKYEQYELFVCEQAYLIATTLGNGDAIQDFWGAEWDEQQRLVPEMSQDHSGNTFGASVNLAAHFLSHPHLLPEMHGALCPLVGCRAYGCWATVAERETA